MTGDSDQGDLARLTYRELRLWGFHAIVVAVISTALVVIGSQNYKLLIEMRAFAARIIDQNEQTRDRQRTIISNQERILERLESLGETEGDNPLGAP